MQRVDLGKMSVEEKRGGSRVGQGKHLDYVEYLDYVESQTLAKEKWGGNRIEQGVTQNTMQI